MTSPMAQLKLIEAHAQMVTDRLRVLRMQWEQQKLAVEAVGDIVSYTFADVIARSNGL